MATKEQISARVPRKCGTSGFANEYTGFFKVKPGHAKQLVDGIMAALTAHGPDVRASYADIDVYDAKYVVFDNDTRMLLHISFNHDFDKYFDDGLMLFSGGSVEEFGSSWVSNLQDSPYERTEKPTWEDLKNFLATNQVKANIFANSCNGTVKELQKAVRVQKAFQQVLDNPEAAQALSHPALKPLLDQAAD
jgi:hypothetical protein